MCGTVYVGGGIAYNHKVKGETLAYENARQLLPHMEYWQALGGLVSDGMSFSKTSWDACVCPSLYICRPVLCCVAVVSGPFDVYTTSALDCVITTPAGIGRLAKPWHRWQEAWVVTRAWQMPMNHLPLPNQPRGRRLSGQLRRASHLPLTPRALVRNQMTATRVVLDATAQCWCCRDFEMYRAKVQRWGDSCEPTAAQSNAILEQRKKFIV